MRLRSRQGIGWHPGLGVHELAYTAGTSFGAVEAIHSRERAEERDAQDVKQDPKEDAHLSLSDQ
jgi:hypothetical protein